MSAEGNDASRNRSPVKRTLGEFKPILTLSISEGGSRMVSFAFYLVAARVLEPGGFGVFRYTTALAGLAFAGVQVVAMSTNRELGAARGSSRNTSAVLGTGLGVAAVVLVISALLSSFAALAGLTGSAHTLGLLGVLAGKAVFELYYSIGRGVGLVRRMALTYLGGSAAQLALLGIVVATARPTAIVVLWIFAGSYVLPVAVLELLRPIVRGRGLTVNRVTAHRLAVLATPLMAAHVAYIVWNTADTIWVENQLGTQQIGIYSAARNLSQMFAILPSAAYGVVMPRVAELRVAGDDRHARRLVYAATLVVAGSTSLVALVVIALRLPILRTLYGEAYVPAAPSLVALAAVGVLYATFVMLSSSAVGWGRPGIYTSAMIVATVAEIAYLLFLTEHLGGLKASTAALASASSIGLALLVVLGQLYIKPLGRAKRSAVPTTE